jgi:CRISPR-associated endoribonuclease Cas6
MPTLIELRLKASWPVRHDTRQLHGLACALFGRHSGPDNAFSVWPLSRVPGGSDDEWTLRAAWLAAGPAPAAAMAEQLRIGHVSCAVTESTQRRVTHGQLASGPGVTGAAVTFHSPTYFSRNGTDCAVPDPRLIVGSWQRRWNASLPAEGSSLAISDEAWRDTHRALHLAAFDLRTETRASGHGGSRTGFTGSAALRLAGDAPESAKAILGTLARFAGYCGTGAQSSHGFGATTAVPAAGNDDG